MFKALLHLKRRGLSAYFWLGTTFLLFSAFLPYAIQQHGLSNAEAIGAFLDGNMPTQTPSTTSSWTTQLVYPNLTFIDPIQLEELPGTQYFLMAGKAGHFWIFDKTDNNTNSKTQVLDISAKVKTSGDAGMMGFALHPEFNQSGSSNNEYIYVWYRYDYDPSYPGNLAYLRLSRFEFDLNTYIIDPSSEYVMIQQYDRHQWHNGGAMFFDDDGILYITVGDEGGANDQYNNGQKIDEGLLAGLLRIDVDNDLSRSHAIIRQPVNPANPPSGWPDSYSQGYTIPDDNPWLDPSGSHLEEFFAIGLRSPHRAALDQQTGNIFFGDIGQSTREEISIIEEGTNLQWPYREGFIAGPKAQPNPLIGVDTDPVYDYPRSVGNCVIGGFVYRGNKWNSILDGKYFFGDHGTRNIYLMSFDPSTGTPDVNYLTTVPAGGVGGKNGISAFATDSVGEIYVLKLYGTDLDGGQIYRLVPSSLTPEPPALLSQAGVFKNLNTLEPEDGLIPYELNVPFWSDGVEKFRWIALPNDGTHDSPGEQIGFSEEGDWNFPVGTVIVKHFEMPLDEANASLTKRLETRLLVHGSDGEYYGVSYRWNDAGTDAELLSDSWLDTLAISTPSNGDREVLWYYPSRQECLTCHTEAAGRVLGPKTRQFNKDILYPSSGVTANQLITMEYLNMFTTNVDTSQAYLNSVLTSAPSDDLSKSLEDRARAYLDANCAYCHRPGNAIQANFDARLSTDLEDQILIYGDLQTSLGLSGMREVVPGDLEHSMMYKRISAVHESFVMPPLAKNQVDSSGVQLISDWIMSQSPNYGVSTDVVRGDYRDDFVGGGASFDWAYYWNNTGPIGNSSNYTPLLWNGNQYDSDGASGLPDAGNLAWGHLDQNGGHPGRAISQGQTDDRFVIAAFTISEAGDYRIGNSLIQDANTSCGNSVEVMVYVDNTFIGTKSIGLGGSDNFDMSLGNLSVGEVVYVGVGPKSTGDGCDGFEMDFSVIQIFNTQGQRIDFPQIPYQQIGNADFNLNATATSGLPVQYDIISGPATVSGSLVSLTGSTGEVRVRARQTGSGTYDQAPEVIRSFWVKPQTSDIGTGLRGTYYDKEDLTDYKFARIDPEIDFYWGTASPDPTMEYNTFSVVWEGEIEVPFTDNITFYTTGDDGMKLWVDGQLIIDEWQDQGASEFSGTVSLNAYQKVPIRLEYYEQSVLAQVRLEWSSSAMNRSVVPQEFLFPATGNVFPLELLSFTGELENRQVDLEWYTLTELNTSHFVVEKSIDGRTFEAFSSVPAAGESQEVQAYADVDMDPVRGMNYYRLQMVDLNGEFTYSPTVQVNLEEDFMKVYPNPVSRNEPIHLEMDFLESQSFDLQLTDLQGRVIYQERIQTMAQKHDHEISTQALGSGVYLLNVYQGEKRLLAQKIVIR